MHDDVRRGGSRVAGVLLVIVAVGAGFRLWRLGSS
jgi:hypothetical protein